MDHSPQPDPGWSYQIKVEGHLNPAWSEWFEDLTLTHEPDGSTVLTGRVVDQAALHGVLIKIRDLGLTLISVQRIGKVIYSVVHEESLLGKHEMLRLTAASA